MKSPFTEDFFKNLIGFATILIIAIAFLGVSGYADMIESEQNTADTTKTN